MLSPSGFRADLHTHTTCSDGTFSPRELILLAKQLGLSGLSITDHDTVAAYKEAITVANEVGILLGTGVEFSSYHQEVSVHLLGYAIRIEHPEILRLCQEHHHRRFKRNQKILEKLARVGMPIDSEFLLGEGVIGRTHIAEKLMEKGYVKSYADAFQRLIGDGKPCFDPGEPISTEETIRVIKESGGKAFLAHPHLLKSGRWLKSLLEQPFDGIECYYARRLPGEERRWVRIAKDKGLLVSGGSDFHGSVRPHVPLGSSWVDEATFRTIFDL